MPIWKFEDWADIKDNAKRIVPRLNDRASISVDKKFLYINDIAMPTGPGSTGMLMLSDSMGRLNWVSADNVGVGATGMQGPTGAYGGPQGETGAQGGTGLGNFYQQSGFSGSTLVPALMWNFQDEAFYGYVTGVNGKWIQVSGGAQVGATGLRGIQGIQGVPGATGAYGGPPGVTGLQGVTGVGSSYVNTQQIARTTKNYILGGNLLPITGLTFYSAPSGVYSFRLVPLMSGGLNIGFTGTVSASVTGSMYGGYFPVLRLNQTANLSQSYNQLYGVVSNGGTTGVHQFLINGPGMTLYESTHIIVDKIG